MPLSLSAISNRASHGLCKAALSFVFIICKGAWLIMLGKGHVDAGGMQEHWRLKLHGNDPLVFHGLAVLGNWNPQDTWATMAEREMPSNFNMSQSVTLNFMVMLVLH